ncbi:MAG: hypothetical protein GY769_05095 [bacterium]|nr:hypothetical protein [bacterium]
MNLRNLTGLALAAVLALLTVPAVAQDYSDHTAVLGMAETITDPLSGEPGRVEWFRQDLGNGQLSHDFVYGDPRRADFNGGASDVTFGVKGAVGDNLSADVNLTDQNFWMYESIATWDDEQCADPMLSQNATTPELPGVVELFFQTGNIFEIWEADLTQVGFYDGAAFPYFAANPNVLGVTFTLFWADADGNLTDIDGNGKFDVAFREIYYNDDFEWADNGLEGPQPSGPRIFDLPTVAIHEVGHGFSAAHFGSIGIKDGFLFAKPRAVMNAIYGGTLRDLLGRDVASHCSNWAQWPNN